MKVTLRVASGPHSGKVFAFNQHDTFLIGRSDTAHLCLPDDKFFSRHHCIIEIAPPQCFLRDLGSTNGTYVNGVRVQTAHLKSGDQVQGGKTMIVVDVTVDTPPVYAGRNHFSSQPSTIIVPCLNCGRLGHAEASSPNEKMSYLCEECREEMRKKPQPIPGYDVVKILGQGGMGSVMLARSQRTGQFVAIKTLLPEVAVSEQSLKRFLREIEVVAALQHPHIVGFIEQGTHNGMVYLVSEFVQGQDAQRLAQSRGGRLPANETAQIIVQTLEALSFAHHRGFIHRDVKEQNILVTGEFPQYVSKLTDFGLAKSFKQTGMSGVTMAGDVAGTIAYMPPEQIRDFRNVQPISDVYALGMTAYSLLTGTIALDLPFQAGIAETVKAIFEKPVVPISHHVPDVPPNFAYVIERALAKNPEQRWASAAEMRNAILQAMPQ